MPIRYEERITRAMLRSEPDTLWMFGDNIAGTGRGGQAAEMRGEPNAVGIPTKHLPLRVERAFFRDCDRNKFWSVALPRFRRLRAHLETGGTVVVPRDGIGTGLAQLEFRAPRIWADLQSAMRKLTVIADASQGIEAEGRDAQRLGAPHESPVGVADAPILSPTKDP